MSGGPMFRGAPDQLKLTGMALQQHERGIQPGRAEFSAGFNITGACRQHGL
jgi:hypothetical protein